MNSQEQDNNAELLQGMASRVNEYGFRAIKQKADLPYFAGIFDTEVNFSINYNSIYIAYDKHNENLLKILSSSLGGNIQKCKPLPNRKSDIWLWSVGSDQTYRILKKIQPFLRINREKARLCIECYEKCAEPGLNRPDKAKISEEYTKLLKDCYIKPEERFDYADSPNSKLAYLAGIFDIDSSFVITRRTEPRRNTYLLEVIKRKSDYETMEFIRGTFGGTIHRASNSRLNKKDIWEIKYTSQKAYAVLKLIYPFLTAQKRIAQICMEFQEKYYTGCIGAQISPERSAIGAKYANMLHSYHLKWRSRYGKTNQTTN